MLRKDYFLKVGMFPDYFFYSNEDNDLSLRLLKSDFVVLPYKEASQGAVLLIALTLEEPVIVTRVGGLPEVVNTI